MEYTLEQLIEKSYEAYRSQLSYYSKIQKYYRGETDVVITKSELDTVSTGKIRNNYLKKFIKSEVDYILANPVTFISLSDEDTNIEKDTRFALAHWKKDHDKKIFRRALTYGEAYELYFIEDSKFFSRILSPLNSYILLDEYDNVSLLIHVTKKNFDDNIYTDVYTSDNRILHYKGDGGNIGSLIGESSHYFNGIPIGICKVDDDEKDILYEDIKSLQDAYETNLSDLSHEISQFRSAYLKFLNVDFDEKDIPLMKQKGILKGTGKDIAIDFVTKNINDAFVMNTLKEIKENLYEISNHINNQQQVPSNNSSLAMRTRQLNLENKTKSNADAMYNLIKTRLKFLYQFLYKLKNLQYDERLIEPKFIVSLPQDDLMMATIASLIPEDTISKSTLRSQFSFIDNVALEKKKIDIEKEEDITNIGTKLLEGALNA